ncbi:MAG: hypothetical protein AAGD01_15300 [Acidobacteriota bacterium]
MNASAPTPDTLANATFVLHLGSTLFLVGLIWTIQVVHYPLFGSVGAAGFAEYERLHAMRITTIVAPAMLLELITAGLLLVARPPFLPRAAVLAGIALLAVIWLSTALIQIPLHGRLAAGFDPAVHASLVASNWIRTVAWSLRGGLLLFFTANGLSQLCRQP